MPRCCSPGNLDLRRQVHTQDRAVVKPYPNDCYTDGNGYVPNLMGK